MAAIHAVGPVKLEIPEDVQPGEGWSKLMLEMAEHIGARDVLVLCETFGGQQVYFPVDPGKAPLAELLGQAKAERLARAFCGSRVTLPTARYAISRAKRAAVIAAVRVHGLTVAQAAAMLHIRRETVSRLVRMPSEGNCCEPGVTFKRLADDRQIEMFPEPDTDRAL